jgi:hypothetical protein
MDEAVDQVMGRSSDEKGADKAVGIRRSQQKERIRLQSEIAAEQKTIAALSEEAAPLRAEFRKVESEVGPIKYIAALIYGDSTDQNVLEKAVRFVIIMIVLVFDPLALTLILAANKQFEWARHGEGGWVHDEEDEQPEDAAAKENTVQLDNEKAPQPPTESLSVVNNAITNMEQELTDTRQLIGSLHEQILASEENYFRMRAALKAAQTQATEQWAQHTDQSQTLTDWKAKFDRLSDKYNEFKVISGKEHQVDQDQILKLEDLLLEITALKEEVPVIEPVAVVIPPPEVLRIAPGYISIDGKVSADNTVDPALLLQADNVPGQAAVAGFGSEFPSKPGRGDVFLRVDVLPNKLYKWNGAQWIQIPKDATDILADDWSYIEYVAKAISDGLLAVEDLSDYEQEQLNRYLTSGGAVA